MKTLHNAKPADVAEYELKYEDLSRRLFERGFRYDATLSMTVIALIPEFSWRAVPVNDIHFTKLQPIEEIKEGYPTGVSYGYLQRLPTGFLITENSKRGIPANRTLGHYLGRVRFNTTLIYNPFEKEKDMSVLDEISGFSDYLMINPFFTMEDAKRKVGSTEGPQQQDGAILVPVHAIADIEEFKVLDEILNKSEELPEASVPFFGTLDNRGRMQIPEPVRRIQSLETGDYVEGRVVRSWKITESGKKS